MTTSVEATRTPCRADAEQAAALLVSVGVSRVLLFGSVTRGEATEKSDVDLVAIYDDLDYADCRDRKYELSRKARDEVGYPVDMHVTDRPEWKIRTETVATPLEAGSLPTARCSPTRALAMSIGTRRWFTHRRIWSNR